MNSTSEIMEPLLNAFQAANLTGLHPRTLRKLARERKIRSYKVLRTVKFRKSDLQELILVREKA